MSLEVPPSFQSQVMIGFQMQFKTTEKLAYCTLIAIGILSGAAIPTLLTASAWTFTLGVLGASIAPIAIIFHRKLIADLALEKIQQAMDLKDEVQQFKQLKIIADKGQREAEYRVARKLHYGIVEDDKEAKLVEAFVYYKKSADHGVAEASFEVGNAYEDGRGIEKNFTEALKYYEKSANQGLGRAHYELGNIYTNGQLNLQIDGAKAFYHYEQAKKLGYC